MKLTRSYSSKKLSRKWQTVLKENPGFVTLWTKYLDFRQTKSITFRYEDIRKVYIECIDVLKTSILDMPSSDCMDCSLHAICELEGILIYVLLRGTLFVREAGFVENAIAIWQALLEFHHFIPAEITATNLTGKRGQEVLLSSFEKFWESEVPRIGEDSAEGWDTFVRNGEVGNVPESRNHSFEAEINRNHIFDSWVTAERLQALKSRVPARTTDEVEDDDPYRVVLFSDIKDFVYYFGSKQTRLSLLDAFMAFCRLPPLPRFGNQNWPQAWWADSFIRSEVSEQSSIYHHQCYFDDQGSGSKKNPLQWSTRMDPEHPSPITQKSPFSFRFRNFPSSLDTLFGDDIRWFASQDRWLDVYPGDTGPVGINWLRRVLRSLASRDAPEYNLAVYCLAFEWKNFPEGYAHHVPKSNTSHPLILFSRVKKVAKALLKKDRTNLLLYNSYALLEWKSGNTDTAANVFVTTIEMSRTLGEAKQRDSILLWKTWVWELLQGDTLEAWQKLLCVPEGKVPVADTLLGKGGDPYKAMPAAVLKARRFLDDGRDSSLALGYGNDAVHFVECSAVLEYLYRSRDADAAMAIFRKASDLFDKRGLRGCIAQELLHHGKARLLRFHATMSRSFKPSLLRDEFAQSIEIFPQNTIFLSLFSWNEARSRIEGRVRSIMSDVVLKERQDTIIGWVFSIWTELNSAPSAGYNTNTVRAAFERAVSNENGKHNPGLWRFYVEFECQQGDTSKAKTIFYRGLKYCPWSKGYAFLAFEKLRDVGFDELRSTYRMLGERELRVHVDLEEAFDAIEEGRQGNGGQSFALPMAIPDDMSTDED
ncbi:hypothetical protein GP486_005384 [Trichoglossum hirsutum]|uniref:Uncharacterized protein n=1 Tax=Trichoglossum hirsutum TaxID=265104 RepID=A0A9P8L9K9_9PEZI|nr:hypothetical protein GP486_005384 [Trichoglossum hirsutum]